MGEIVGLENIFLSHQDLHKLRAKPTTKNKNGMRVKKVRWWEKEGRKRGRKGAEKKAGDRR